MRRFFAVLVVACAAAAAASSALAASHPLRTAIFEPDFTTSASDVLLDRTVDAGATAVRIPLNWSGVAPSVAPSDPSNYASPGYNWSSVDRAVSQADARGLDVYLSIVGAPSWALVSPAAGYARTLPSPLALGEFALAAATRYSGLLPGKPRVRYWQVWNEPNISLFLGPQFLDGQPFSPGWYRQMVNAVATSVKAVHPDNLVVAGGTAPFYDNTPAVTAIDSDWGPLSFMRSLLCLGPNLKPTCSDTVHFDIWAHDAYSSGGPTHHAALPNDVSLADLPEMRAVLEAAQLAGHIDTGPAPVQLWLAEYSWDSNPPDPNGVPEPLLSRWTAQALYSAWKSGVSLFTWFLLRDQPLDSSPYQSGLYTRGATVAGDQAKPNLQAFRFPLVAFARRNQVAVWGRTPGGQSATVTIEQANGSNWTTLGTLPTDDNGIFRHTYATSSTGSIRAEALSAASVPFSLARVPDQSFNPFGGPVLEPAPTRLRPSLPVHKPADESQRVAIEKKLRGEG